MAIKILFQSEVCWNWDRKKNGTYLDLIVFDRGNGMEVIRTAKKNWQEALEQGTIKAAAVPSHISEKNIEEIIYEKDYLLPLIG
jgi:hypothetical protein